MLNAVSELPWWAIVLSAIGAAALATVVLSLFSSLGRRSDGASATDVPEVDTEEFLHAVAGMANAPLIEGGTAEVLNNGVEFWPAIEQAIREARCSVNFMTYIWESGELSDRLLGALTTKAREGVPVRVMLDAIGGLKAPDDKMDALVRAGGRVHRFHPPRFGKLTRFHRRNHRRAIIVDGEVGYTGGAAVSDRWLGNAEGPERWRDCMVEVRGPIATNLQSAFAQLWANETGEILVGPAYYPPRSGSDGRQPGIDHAGEPISRHVNLVSSPSAAAHPLRRLFWISFRAARKQIYITNPYFVPDDTTCGVLKERAQAGVDVRVLVPNEHIDLPPIRWASHSYYEDLLTAGIRIYEYQPTMIHQKMAVVDGRWSVVGSANMDVRSKELNQENVLAILDEGFARQVEETFLRDLQRAQEIRLDDWRRRSWLGRVRERAALLFEEQF